MPMYPVGNGKFVEVDEEDVVAMSFHQWSPDNRGYIRTEIKGKNILLHKFIGKRIGLNVNLLIDHKDRNKLNYKRDNLRNATHSQNQHNKGVSEHNQLGIKGVRKFRNKYRSAIRNPNTGKRIHLGTFDTWQEAQEAYRDAAYFYYKEYANPNSD